ncbi:MAG: alanine/ornithine racemase family PLP-dependent enzyme [Anaerolineae bacterium]
MRIEIDCEAIRHNAEGVVQACAARGIQVAAVTKACCGHPEVARAMLAGGAGLLAESRLNNVRRLREAGIKADVLLLRLPRPSEAADVVRLTQMSLNSEVETVRVLSRAAQAQGLTHQVILMVEMGDRREGIMHTQALDAAQSMLGLPGIDLAGIGSNVACISGVLPSRENVQSLIDVAESIEQTLGIRFRVISGGNTYNLDLLDDDQVSPRVNQLRIGHGILVGPPTPYKPLPFPFQTVFNVVAEVIEVQTKPSAPEGQTFMDAFGLAPHWEDLGDRRRAILAIGHQDLRIDGLRPKRPGVTIIGASSDHLVMDVTEADPPVHVGDEMEFDPIYAAVATAMASVGVTQVIKPMAE